MGDAAEGGERRCARPSSWYLQEDKGREEPARVSTLASDDGDSGRIGVALSLDTEVGSGGLDSFIYEDNSQEDNYAYRNESRDSEYTSVYSNAHLSPCIVEHDVSNSSLRSSKRDAGVFEGFREHDDKMTAEVMLLLTKLDNMLYHSDSPRTSPKNANLSSQSEKRGIVEGDSPTFSRVDEFRRNNLVRRHNFETHNRPQAQHLAPRVDEWTSVFPHLRVVGTSFSSQNESIDEKSSIGAADRTLALRGYACRAERPLLYRPSSPLRTPRCDLLSAASDFFVHGQKCYTDMKEIEHEEEVFASHGKCKEWIERHPAGQTPTCGEPTASRKASSASPHEDGEQNSADVGCGRQYLEERLVPVEPRYAIYNSIMCHVFDTLWLKITPLLAPLLRQLVESMLRASPFWRHDIIGDSDDVTQKRRYHNGGQRYSHKAPVHNDSASDTGQKRPFSRSSSISMDNGDGFGGMMTITALKINSSTRNENALGVGDRWKKSLIDESPILNSNIRKEDSNHVDIFGDRGAQVKSYDKRHMVGMRAKSAGRSHTRHPLQPKPSSARRRMPSDVHSDSSILYNRPARLRSLAGSAVQTSINDESLCSAVRAGGFRVHKVGTSSSTFRSSTLAIAGNRSFKGSRHHVSLKHGANSRTYGPFDSGLKDRRQLEGQPRSQNSNYAPRNDALRLPFLSHNTQQRHSGFVSPARGREGLAYNGRTVDARGGGFNMLPVIRKGVDDHAWVSMRSKR